MFIFLLIEDGKMSPLMLTCFYLLCPPSHRQHLYSASESRVSDAGSLCPFLFSSSCVASCLCSPSQSNKRKVGGSIPTLMIQNIGELTAGGVTMLAGRCDWPPTTPVYVHIHEYVTLCTCMCVFNRCQPGWVESGVILCIYMYLKVS